MKICLSVLIVLSYSLLSAQQASDGYLLDSSYCEIYEEGSWARDYFIHYKYDAENRLAGLESIYWDQPSNTVSYISNSVLEYNTRDSVSTLTTQVGVGPGDPVLENTYKYEYSYDGNHWSQTFYYNWDTAIADWNLYQRSNFTYDGAGNRTEEQYDKSVETYFQWADSLHRSYQYGDGGELISVYESYPLYGGFYAVYKTSYYYVNGMLDHEIYEFYDNVCAVIDLLYEISYTYTSDNAHIASIYKDSNNGGANWLKLFTYDSNGNLIQYIYSGPDEVTYSGYAERVIEYEYDDQHNQIYSIYKKRNSPSGSLVNERRCYNYFSVNILPVVDINPGSSHCLFSNPVSDAITLNCQALSGQTGLHIRILDMTGRVVTHSPFQSGASISMEGVTPGLYFFQVLQKQEVLASGKVVRQ